MNIESIWTDMKNLPENSRNRAMRVALAACVGMFECVERGHDQVRTSALLEIFTRQLRDALEFEKRFI